MVHTGGGREKGSRTRVVYITTLVVSQYDMCHNKELLSSSSERPGESCELSHLLQRNVVIDFPKTLY